jgi:hypothetical protein
MNERIDCRCKAMGTNGRLSGMEHTDWGRSVRI